MRTTSLSCISFVRRPQQSRRFTCYIIKLFLLDSRKNWYSGLLCSVYFSDMQKQVTTWSRTACLQMPSLKPSKTKKPYISLIHKAFCLFARFPSPPPTHLSPALLGWKKGLEPSAFGTTIRRSNQLSYIHHVDTDPVSECKGNTFFRSVQKKRPENGGEFAWSDNLAVRPARLSPRNCQKTVGTSIVGKRGASRNECNTK